MSQKTLELLILNPKITILELAQQINRSGRTVKRILQKLQKEAYLKRIGPDKGGYWEVVKKHGDKVKIKLKRLKRSCLFYKYISEEREEKAKPPNKNHLKNSLMKKKPYKS